MSRPATPYPKSDLSNAQSSVSKPGITWMCTVQGLISNADGMRIYSVHARKTPFHAFEWDVPYLYMPESMGIDELPKDSAIFCHRIYRTVNNEVRQYFIPAENPYLL